MTGPDLAGLRQAIADRAGGPAAATLRRRAERQLRVRRTTSAAVGLIAVAMVAVVLRVAGTPEASPATPPSSARPSASPSGPPQPITGVDWSTVTMTLPPRAGCPDGPQQFAARPDGERTIITSGTGAFWARLVIDRMAVGDLTGDGHPEAVIPVECTSNGHTGYSGGRLAVNRSADGQVVALGWVSASRSSLGTSWITDRTLFIGDIMGETGMAGANALRWQDGQFVPVDSSAYPGITGPRGEDGLPVDLRPVSARLPCRPGVVRLGWGNLTLRPVSARLTPLLMDLDGNGRYRVVVGLECSREASGLVDAVVVLDRTDTGFVAVAAAAVGRRIHDWRYVDRVLYIRLNTADRPAQEVAFRWTGSTLTR